MTVGGILAGRGAEQGNCLPFRHQAGQRVNPLNERFIPGEPIAASERAAFDQHTRELLGRLEEEASFNSKGPLLIEGGLDGPLRTSP